jgi:serine/threonine-protein kinase RIO1
MNLNSASKLVEKIRAEKNRPNWPMPIKYIGGGADGRVYLTETGKLMKVTFDADPQEFRGLAKLQNTGLVPTFNKRNWVIMGKTKKGTKITAFLMGQVGKPGDAVMTLHEYLKQRPRPSFDWKSKVARMIRKMHAYGVSHGDLHEKNILVVVSPNGDVKMYIIDFGRAVFFPKGMTERNFYKSVLKAKGVFPTGTMNVPLFYNKKEVVPHRANVHMATALYKPVNRANENRVRKGRIHSIK